MIKNIIVIFFKIFKILCICSNVTLYLYLFILLSIYSLYNYLPIIIIFEKTNIWQHSFQHFINFQKSFRNKRNLKNNIQKHNCNFDSHSLLLSSKILFILPTILLISFESNIPRRKEKKKKYETRKVWPKKVLEFSNFAHLCSRWRGNENREVEIWWNMVNVKKNW